MKVNKSTQICNEYNSNNKDTIELGLVESWEPADNILKQEQEDKELKDKWILKEISLREFWYNVIFHLSEENKKLFDVVNSTYFFVGNNDIDKNLVPRVKIEKFCRGYNSNNGYWRVVIANYGRGQRDTIIKCATNDACLMSKNLDFILKVANKITEKIISLKQENDYNLKSKEQMQNKNKFFEDNKELFAFFGLNYTDQIGLNSTNDKHFISAQVRYNLTLEQWKALKEWMIINVK